MVSPSFTSKQIRVTFALTGTTTFSNGSNTITITGLRMAAEIQSMQFPAFPQADIEIFGMLQADMNTLIDFENHQLAVTRNSMTIEANGGTGWTTIFNGQIIAATPIYENAPDVALHVKGRVLGYESIAPAQPLSYTGGTSAAEIVSSIASSMHAGFENDGVTATLASPYLPGTAADQLAAVADAANLSIFYDYGPAGAGNPITIIITPKGLARSTAATALSPATGLVNYPSLDSVGWVFCRSFFNPALRFGGSVTISGSDLPRANATWQILQLTHSLDAVKPDGLWFSDMHLMPSGAFPYPQ